MKYPRLSEDLDRRRKLTLDQIEVIRKLHEEGWSHRRLAKEFRVSKTTIRYHVVDDEKRKVINKHRYEKLTEQEMFDPDFAKRHKAQTKESYKRNLKLSLEKRIYKGKITYKWKKTKYHTNETFREKIKEQAREPNRILFNKKYNTIPKFREYVNEKNKQNYIKRLI